MCIAALALVGAVHSQDLIATPDAAAAAAAAGQAPNVQHINLSGMLPNINMPNLHMPDSIRNLPGMGTMRNMLHGIRNMVSSSGPAAQVQAQATPNVQAPANLQLPAGLNLQQLMSRIPGLNGQNGLGLGQLQGMLQNIQNGQLPGNLQGMLSNLQNGQLPGNLQNQLMAQAPGLNNLQNLMQPIQGITQPITDALRQGRLPDIGQVAQGAANAVPSLVRTLTNTIPRA